MTSAPSWHIHVSERQTGSWVDCTPDSTVEWARLCHDKKIAATHAEGDALRIASKTGKTGGMNAGDMITAIKNRYAWTSGFKHLTSFAALQATLVPGWAGMIQGSMSAFGPNHRLSVWDRNFDGGHAVCLMNIGGTLLWCDPEAPTNASVPVVVSWTEVKSFVTAFAGGHLVAPILTTPTPTPAPTGGDMPALTTYIPGSTADVKALSNIRADAKITATKFRMVPAGASEPVVLTGTVAGDVDPANGSNVWFTWWKNGRWEYTAKDNIINIKSPTVTDCKPAIDAAVATQKTTDAVALAAAVAEANTQATTAEHERIALAEAERVRNL